jgi:hypothetical protein
MPTTNTNTSVVTSFVVAVGFVIVSVIVVGSLARSNAIEEEETRIVPGRARFLVEGFRGLYVGGFKRVRCLVGAEYVVLQSALDVERVGTTYKRKPTCPTPTPVSCPR